jgi:anti-sigma regulatory factor (Ser/Thr protein kinase)
VSTFVPLLDREQAGRLPARAREVVENRKSGLSLNHIQGCPLDCAYCIRHTYGRWDQRQPRALMSDAEAAERLVSHRYFQPHITPLRLLNRATDPPRDPGRPGSQGRTMTGNATAAGQYIVIGISDSAERREAAVIIGGWRGPGWHVFDADPRLGRQIRDWIRSAISGHDCPVDAADAALAVIELFSNAVRHGPAGGRVLVGYCLWQQGARLVVCDAGGPGTPRLVHGGQLAESGRGLSVVDALAARWGSFRLAGAQAVWCDFGQPLHAAASDAWAWLDLVLSVCDLSASDHPMAAAMPGALIAAGTR